MMRLVPHMCRSLFGSGKVVNMDRAYTAPRVFVKLMRQQVYARGTVKLDSQYLPSFLEFKKRQMAKRINALCCQ